MAKVTLSARVGGPGLGSHEVGDGCGLHKRIVSHPAVLDPSAAASTFVLFGATTACTIQKISLHLTEIVATNSKVFRVGTISSGGTADDDYYSELTVTTVTGAAAAVLEMTLTNSAVAADTLVTAACTNVADTGEGYIVVEYTVDDEA